MGDSVIGAQLFTVREFTQTPADIAKTIKKLSKIGYKAVQVSGAGPMDPKELRRILDGEGVKCAATHVGFEQLRDNLDKVAEEHAILGCTYPAIGGMPGEYRSGDGYLRFAKDASKVADNMARRGLTFGYHNHSFELEKFGGRAGLDILIAESSKAVTFEIDTFWIQHGGGDPVAWINKVKGRIPLLHLKDMGIVNGQQVMTEVGEGNLEWPAILEAAREAGTIWYLVEQDTCQRDPFESLAISLKNLKAMGLR